MNEQRKTIFIIIFGLAVLFLLTTRFCLPVAKDNRRLVAELKNLEAEHGTIERLDSNKLDSWEKDLGAAISNLEQRFPPEGKLKLVEQLTQVPDQANIVFAKITHKQPQQRKGYQAIPVELNIKTTFYDLIRYLVEIETSPTLITVDSLRLLKIASEGGNILDIAITFLGFRLTQEFPAISQYMQDRLKPIDQERLVKLLEPAQRQGARDAVGRFKELNPFVESLKRLDDRKIETAPKPVPSQQDELSSIDGLALKGILSIGDRKAALINDQVVKEGQMIEGMTVAEIDDSRVILRRSGKEYILKMGVVDGLIKPE